ncbi:PilN domain-containing protein [Vibrio ponticus]|uniref:PilN domain-containing protein n=1 Tax=Vibrio ponticus TaxID=265668 RepID=UPI0011153D09|nr:PilN domain-containing protein [Vibrio ponticus]
MLHRINLLPWREQQLKHQQRRFISMLVVSIVIAYLLLLGAGSYIESQQQIQQQRLDYLNTHLAKLNHQQTELAQRTLQQQALQQQLQQLSDLQWQRNQPTLLMQLLASLIPQGVYLESMTLKAQLVTIKGVAHSTEQLTHLLESFETSQSITQVVMHSIQHSQQASSDLSQTFHLSFRLPLRPEKNKKGEKREERADENR